MADLIGAGAAVIVVVGYLVWLAVDSGKRILQPSSGPSPRPAKFALEKEEAYRDLRQYLPPVGQMQLLSGQWVPAGWLVQYDDEGHPYVSRMDIENVVWYLGQIYELLPGQSLRDAVDEQRKRQRQPFAQADRAVEDTLYEVLDIAETATPSQVSDAYQRLVRLTHPDKGGSAALFRRVQLAFETLSDPERRTAYDQALHQARTRP